MLNNCTNKILRQTQRNIQKYLKEVVNNFKCDTFFDFYLHSIMLSSHVSIISAFAEILFIFIGKLLQAPIRALRQHKSKNSSFISP